MFYSTRNPFDWFGDKTLCANAIDRPSNLLERLAYDLREAVNQEPQYLCINEANLEDEMRESEEHPLNYVWTY